MERQMSSPTEEQRGNEDEYEVLRPIGSGSFGQVFLVLHKVEQREFVMKSIDMQGASDENREATELEVKLLRNLRHPNIVAYRDSFVDRAGCLCILMEFCEHGDISVYLEQAKKTNRYPPEERLSEWFIQITLALHALHRKRILHRDLKTPNIFLTGSKIQGAFALKLGDFGIAKALNSTGDLAMTQIGTPFYMSPELINNKPYGVKSDIWGLGCVLYEIINGKRAFDAQSLNGLALKIIKGNYNAITVTCSPGMQALIKSMLSTKPKNRPSLREILLTASVRSRIPRAVRNVVAAGMPEQKYVIEQALAKQLASLGLGSASNGQGKAKDPRKLEQQLQRAEQRKQREEEVLQHTVALLEQCLHGPGAAETGDDWRSPRSQASLPSHRSSREQRDPPPDLPGRVSHRRSHRHRGDGREERPREDAHPRFHEETRNHREEGVHQRLNASERRDRHASGGDLGQQRPRAFSEHALAGQAHELHDSRHTSSMPWLAGAHSVSEPPTARRSEPRSGRSGSKTRSQRAQEPVAPPVQYSEPHPPAEKIRGGHAGSCRTGEFGASGPPRPKVALQLEALSGHYAVHTEVEQTRLPPPYTSPRTSDPNDSMSDGSLTEVQEMEEWEGLSDVSEEPDQRGGRQQTLQQRISQCQDAISRHKMTIEMLEYSVLESTEQMASLGGGQTRPGSMHGADDMARRPVVPAVVQDSSARLMRRCLDGLGSEKFQAARRCLQASVDAAELPSFVRSRMLDLLGIDKIGFLSLLDQLVYMERRWGIQEYQYA